MATRSGSFGGGLNPFGGSSGAGLGGWDIGADLADLEVYKVEVAWGNGLATDAEYIAALNKALAATDPNTQRHESAQNKLDDANYRIGRSKASAAGLDSVIAFDQAAIGKMNPDNLRYRDVKDSLDSELAQRRSRDYGKLVTDYNAGKTSTKSLLSWVDATLGTINKDDPDFENWQGTHAELTDRVASETDSKAYQDFQQGRMKPDAFLGYLTTRRNAFDVQSPQYADWDRRLEDAKKQVADQKQSVTDTAFFSSYEEGHKSDTQYMDYLRKRITGMTTDDPDRASWQHRLNQAAFSLAEDKLRFDVERGKQPVSRLVKFYQHYRATLNPGSAEWRTVTRALDSLHGGARSGGGGSRGGGGSAKGSASAAGALSGTAKVIQTYTINGAYALMTINPHAPKKAQTAAKKFFDLNYNSMENARQRGDDVFLFFDPRKPGSVVAARNPDGSPMLDGSGKPIMIRGSAYLPVTDEAFGTMNVLKANYQFALAERSLADNDPAQYAFHTKEGMNAMDKARFVGNQSTVKALDEFYRQAQDGIDSAIRRGDYTAALNLSNEVAKRLSSELRSNPNLDDTRRDKLDRLGEKLAANPLIPKVDPLTGRQIGGAIDLAASTRDAAGNFEHATLLPGWHHVLDKTNEAGQPVWGPAYDDVQDGSWEARHIPITTSYGKHVVSGEVSVRTAGTNPTVFVTTDEGQIRVNQSAQYITFTDENGRPVKAYSLDGRTWIRSLSGTAPQVEVNAQLSKAGDGSGLVDTNGKLVFKANEPGNADAGYTFVGDQSLLGWYGQAANAARLDPHTADITNLSKPGRRDPLGDAIYGRGGQFLGYRQRPQDLGGPGQQMQLLRTGDGLTLTFLSDRQQQDLERQLQGRAGGPGSNRALPTGQGQRPNEFIRPGPIAAQRPVTFAGIDLSGILATGVGLLKGAQPPARLGGFAPVYEGKKGQETVSIPALKAIGPGPGPGPRRPGGHPPPPRLKAGTSIALPTGKARDDLVLPKTPIRKPRARTITRRTTTPTLRAL
jgi:hypothetical protein